MCLTPLCTVIFSCPSQDKVARASGERKWEHPCVLHSLALSTAERSGWLCGMPRHLLVLELVALGLGVVAVVDVRVDLARLAVLAKQAAQHALTTDPEDLAPEPSYPIRAAA